MDILLMLPLALVLDLLFGEPPQILHPVVWMGKSITLVIKTNRASGRVFQFALGLLSVLFVTAVFTTAAHFVLLGAREWHYAFYIVLGGILLKTTFSVRALYRAAWRVRDTLAAKDPALARQALPSLVSRDTGKLDDRLMVSAAVESVAESIGDSFIAPLFYFVIFGVPGAVAYRVANTFDAMIGYHGRNEYIGKFAARLDDVLNYIPARIAALLIITVTAARGQGKAAWRTALLQHRRTESPNAGWPIAAAAGALEVRLEKPGHYVIDGGHNPLQPSSIDNVLRLCSMVLAAWSLICLGAGGIRYAF
ncbi:cobalamin biosynthesis protein [Chloroflexota bacterium]